MRKIDLDGERAFENRKASGEMVREAQSKYYWATEIPTSSHIELTNLEIRGKSVLEVGCSSGYDASTYCEYANSYVGVDISDEAINNCKKLKIGNANFFCTDGHTLPINDNSVDYEYDVSINDLKGVRNGILRFDFVVRNGTIGLLFSHPGLSVEKTKKSSFVKKVRFESIFMQTVIS